MKFHFGQEALVLPGSVLAQVDADAVQLRVLLWIASDLSLAQKPSRLAKLAECSQREAAAAVSFWQSRGILSDGESIASLEAPALAVAAAPTPLTAVEVASKKPLQRADELPNYTSAELADLLETRAGLRALVDEAQQILGKIFNPSEVNILVAMCDYLGLCEEGILLLLSHCKRIGKTGLRSIEKYAYRLIDRGIDTPAALDEEFRTVEALHGFEGQVRGLFGMKSRSLTGKEEGMLRAWVQYGYDIEIVRHAYEITVNATSEPSLPYANTILKRWHEEGLSTLEAILAAEEQAREKKLGNTAVLGNSFDTDDFFQAALERSFRETGFKQDS